MDQKPNCVMLIYLVLIIFFVCVGLLLHSIPSNTEKNINPIVLKPKCQAKSYRPIKINIKSKSGLKTKTFYISKEEFKKLKELRE